MNAKQPTPPPQNATPVPGVRLGVAEAAIKKPGRADLAVLALDEGAQVAAVFTRNAFCAAPVTLARRHLASGQSPRALVINSGNANAGTGARGVESANAVCEAVAAAAGCRTQAVLPFSTGVIGEPLPVARMCAAVPAAIADLAEDGWLRAVHAIMTTDTVAKVASRQVTLGDRTVTVTGIAKGSGMIRPDMATMLAFVATDAAVAPVALSRLLGDAVDASFNSITVDGDTSTNDACVLIATGAAGGEAMTAEHPDFAVLATAVESVCVELAQAIVRDGEGATRFIEVEVSDAASIAEARLVAYAVAESPLVKTAAFAGDPNWGRILAAVGRAGVPEMDIGGVDIHLDTVRIVRAGEPDPNYREADGAAVMTRPEYAIRIALGRGTAQARVWTCDFSYDYVRINAEYRS